MLLVFATLLGFTQTAFASNTNLSLLTGSWNEFDGFVSLNQCATAPRNYSGSLCSPAQIPYISQGRLEVSGFLSATDSSLAILDTLRKNEINSSDVNKLFSKYNYSNFLVDARISYLSPFLYLGARPVRIQGEFEVHNPNLPLGSVTFRDDLEVFAGTGYSVESANWIFSGGTTATLLFRREGLAEASLIDFAARPSNELLATQSIVGTFFDVGTRAELKDTFVISGLFKDLGGFFNGVDRSASYLFIHQDHLPRVYISAAVLPRIGYGTLQVGGELLSFFSVDNHFDKQWVGTASYYIGPLRVLSALRPGFIRTGLATRFSTLEVAVSQEWVNTLETGSNAQPHFNLGVTASL